MTEGPSTSKRWGSPRWVPTAKPGPLPTTFNRLLREYRQRTGMSQNQLARRSGVDPAYINRLELAKDDSTSMPRRQVVLAIWGVLQAEPHGSIGEQDRERLLVAAGLVPEVILRAGGWDAYLRRVRRALTHAVTGVDSAED